MRLAGMRLVRFLDPTGTGKTKWAMRWKPALNAFAVTFGGTTEMQKEIIARGLGLQEVTSDATNRRPVDRPGAGGCRSPALLRVPGESFLGVLDALYDSSIKMVSTRHEGGGSFAATGYARTSGEIGVCFGTRAVGTANMAIGIHNARQDSLPMIAFAVR